MTSYSPPWNLLGTTKRLRDPDFQPRRHLTKTNDIVHGPIPWILIITINIKWGKAGCGKNIRGALTILPCITVTITMSLCRDVYWDAQLHSTCLAHNKVLTAHSGSNTHSEGISQAICALFLRKADRYSCFSAPHDFSYSSCARSFEF